MEGMIYKGKGKEPLGNCFLNSFFIIPFSKDILVLWNIWPIKNVKIKILESVTSVFITISHPLFKSPHCDKSMSNWWVSRVLLKMQKNAKRCFVPKKEINERVNSSSCFILDIELFFSYQVETPPNLTVHKTFE